MDIFDSIVHSPIEKVSTVLLDAQSISLSVKREDKLHPTISGNKWRKLKYNLKQAKDIGCETVITFGGAFSNHIYSTASACKAVGIKSVGIIRGDFDKDNPTLIFARACGMELVFVSRSDYREKENSPTIKGILDTYTDYILIAEGGSNDLATQGISELAEEINETSYDTILVSAGTGATASGILQHLHPNKELWVFSSLKTDYLHDEIINNVAQEKYGQLKFINTYHYGGYGKSPKELIDFMNDFKAQTQIPTDPIYNGKLIAGFSDMVNRKKVNTSGSYLWIHTGGLQGIDAYNYMANKKGRPLLK